MPAQGYRPPKATPKPKPPRQVVANRVNRATGLAAMPNAAATTKAYGPGPVKVYTSPRAAPGTAATIKQASRSWNKASNSKIFKPTTSRKKADVVVSSSKGLQRTTGAAGLTRDTKRKGKPTRIAIDSKWAGNSPNLAAHELGHAAGLGHPNPRKRNEYSNHGRIMGSGSTVTPKEARAAAKLTRARKLRVKPEERTAAKKKRKVIQKRSG